MVPPNARTAAVHQDEAVDMGVGSSPSRKEDWRLTRGEGRYVADISLPGMLHAAVLRSPVAHADIVRIDTSPALEIDGVVSVHSAADLGKDNVPLFNSQPHPALNVRMPLPLAEGRVRYAGEPIAIVVATDRYTAEDGVQAIQYELSELAGVFDAATAVNGNGSSVHSDQPDNVAAEFSIGFGDYEQAKQQAALVVSSEFEFDRVLASPLECRGVVASYRPHERQTKFEVWTSTQMPHNVRRALADMLNIGQEALRVVAPDVGGGFGVKACFYPEEYLVTWLSRELRRPVAWIEDRDENFVQTNQARAQYHTAELCVDQEGRILGLRDDFVHDNGAYTSWGVTVPALTAQGVIGPYTVPALDVRCRVAFTNLTPTSAYRGAGRPQSTFVIERLVDLASRRLGIDPLEMRRINFIPANQFPYEYDMVGRDGKRLTYDSGDYGKNLDAAISVMDVDGLKAQQANLRSTGRLVGLGTGVALEKSGLGPTEGALVRVDAQSGEVIVYTGASSQGQGQETSLAQIAAGELGIPLDQVQIVLSDTADVATGVGAIASRIATVGGNAVAQACQSLRQKCLLVASSELNTDADDLVYRNGAVSLKHGDGAVTVPSAVPSVANASTVSTLRLRDLAWAASAPVPGATLATEYAPALEALEYFKPPGVTYAAAVHIGMVEVDPQTGHVEILAYGGCHDSGTLVNPQLVRGQIHGGIAAGIGNALMERVIVDAGGRPLTSDYLKYSIPTAADVPAPTICFMETESPLNPLGVKGVGQAGTMPVPAVIAAAIDDALSGHDDVFVNRFPMHREYVWQLCGSSREMNET